MAEKTMPIPSLKATGLLYALNKHVLHPQGFELREAVDGSLSLAGWADTPRDYRALPDGVEDAAWRTYRQTLYDAISANRPRPSSDDVPGVVMPWPKPTR